MNIAAKKLPISEELSSKSARSKLTQMIMRLFDEWSLTTAEQLTLLGLRETSRNMLIRYRNLNSIIPYDQDKLDRIGILLAIYKNLYDLFPENETIRKTWIKRQHKMFDNKRPLDLMLEGLFGLANVMRFLDLEMVS